VASVTAAARSAGVRPEDIRTIAPLVLADPDEFEFEETTGDERGSADLVAGRPEQYVRSTIEFQLRDPGRAEALQRALEQAGAERVAPPTYALADDRAARRAARDEAIRLARAEAEAYAASLGLRVARIVRVTERLGIEAFGLLASNPSLTRRFRDNRNNREPEVDSHALVGVDFALAPR